MRPANPAPVAILIEDLEPVQLVGIVMTGVGEEVFMVGSNEVGFGVLSAVKRCDMKIIP